MDNLTTAPITDTSSTQNNPASTNEQKKEAPETTTPAKGVGGDQNNETDANTVVKENKEINAA